MPTSRTSDRALDWIRTSDHRFRKPELYPLSYKGMVRAERFELPEQMHLGYSQARPSNVGALSWVTGGKRSRDLPIHGRALCH